MVKVREHDAFLFLQLSWDVFNHKWACRPQSRAHVQVFHVSETLIWNIASISHRRPGDSDCSFRIGRVARWRLGSAAADPPRLHSSERSCRYYLPVSPAARWQARTALIRDLVVWEEVPTAGGRTQMHCAAYPLAYSKKCQTWELVEPAARRPLCNNPSVQTVGSEQLAPSGDADSGLCFHSFHSSNCIIGRPTATELLRSARFIIFALERFHCVVRVANVRVFFGRASRETSKIQNGIDFLGFFFSAESIVACVFEACV